MADKGWQRKFEDPISTAGRQAAHHASRRRRLHHQPAEERVRLAGMANGDRGPDAGVAQRSDDDGADRGHEGAQSRRSINS